MRRLGKQMKGLAMIYLVQGKSLVLIYVTHIM